MIPAGFLLPAILLLNLSSFLMFGYDKQQAKAGLWRISEKNLLLISIAGPFGAYAGMQIFRHKTQKNLFTIAIPLLIILQLALIGTGIAV